MNVFAATTIAARASGHFRGLERTMGINREQFAKSQSVMNAARKLAQQYRDEGSPDLGNLVENSIGALPVDSLAKLHDFIREA